MILAFAIIAFFDFIISFVCELHTHMLYESKGNTKGYDHGIFPLNLDLLACFSFCFPLCVW